MSPCRYRAWIALRFSLTVLCGAALSSSLARAVPLGAGEADAPNLLVNSDFTHGADSWQLERVAPAAADLRIVGTTASGRVSGNAARVEVTSLGSEIWHVQLCQTGLTLEQGETYTLAFWSRADRPRRISLNANVDVEDGHGIGLTVDGISLGTEWRKFAYVFTAARPQKDHCRIAFLLGEEKGGLSLAGVTLRKGKFTIPVGPNLLRDGQFRPGADLWTFETKAPAEATWTLLPRSAAPTGVISQVAHAVVKAPGEENWHIQAMQNGLDLNQGETYSLSFWARADRPRPLSIVASLDTADWHRIAPDSQVSLGPEWKKQTVTFTTAHTVPKHSRIVFVLGDASGTVELAEVSLQREALKEAAMGEGERPAAPHPLIGAWESEGPASARRLLFTFNPDGTGSIRDVTAAKASQIPRARVPSAFRWYVKSPAASDVTIGKETYAWTISRLGATVRLALKDAAGKTHPLVRR